MSDQNQIDPNKGKREFFIVMSFILLAVNIVGFAIALFGKPEDFWGTLIAVGLFDLWIIGNAVIVKVAEKLYPKNPTP